MLQVCYDSCYSLGGSTSHGIVVYMVAGWFDRPEKEIQGHPHELIQLLFGSPSGQLTKDYRDSFQLWVEKDGKLVTKIGDTQLQE